MKLFKDGTLFIPPRALQFFSFVLRGEWGAACETMFHLRRMVLFRSRPGSRNVQKEKQNDDIFSNEPGIFFLEQTFVGRWSANRAARDDGSVANDVFRISVGGGSLEEELEDLFSKENR